MADFRKDLLHPDLQNISEWEFRIRTGLWSRLFYCKREEWINWYGDMLRDSDDGQGMYATDVQHKAWPRKVVSDTKIGPS